MPRHKKKDKKDKKDDLHNQLRDLESLLNSSSSNYSSRGGKAEYERYFTVHTVNGRPAKEVLKGETGRYGMSKYGGPLSAAKKAYTSMLHKLGLKNKGQSTELTFEMREITKDPNKRHGSPIYGPYEGFREAIPKKLRDQDPFLKKHGIKHRAVVHLLGKKNMLKKTTGGRKKRGGSSCGSHKGGDFFEFFN